MNRNQEFCLPSREGRGESSIDVITLGCSKNLVDSERLICQLEAAGYRVTHDSEEPQGEIAVVNTCGFIADAQEESINTILELAQRKNEGRLKRLYVMGCLSQRFLKDLQKEIPEVDRYFGKFDWNELLTELGKSYREDLRLQRRLTTPRHYAYLKISEGCDRHCSYCAIPIITGRHVSRPMEEIEEEVRGLVRQGVKEFQIIAQELTYYGLDLYHERRIAQLVERISLIPGVEWIRLHYAYPTDFPHDLFRVMRERPNVCKYMDVALQHIADPVLKAMRRHITREETYRFVEDFRREVPGVHLRTTLMVGHPGETEKAFQELLEFVRWARFERMGAFAYSEEMGTYSASAYSDDIPEEVKQARLSKLMRLQQRISGEIQAEKVGQTLRVIIDRREGDYFVGRTEFDSPEVDPEVLIDAAKNADLRLGEFYDCRITEADDFDLYGVVINN
ncbi:MAG: 30S ribosomal protein S12 methylthiotransferase RimO [Bacteroidaceae bacterium]|nr:30S ribosomal protein S12 methylthiotransferase RimO [Bacteroidaceae bacterium]MBR1789697.1 30S ribosomal protein S12 methylthiotransferase RimO [Bacteroidaceae bacterium]